MSQPQRFRYPRGAILKDYGQAAVGALMFGAPLIFAGGNVYITTVLGAIMAMFLCFGWSTWRRQASVIVVTEDAIGLEGARSARISWPEITRVDLRYFAPRARRERGGGEGTGWMQLRLDGGKTTIRIDSALDGFDQVARRVAEATHRHRLAATPATKSNFAALGLAPDQTWAEEA